jgi:hypothetical protein
LTLIIVAAIAVIWFAERSVEHLKLAIAALCFSAAVLLFVVADFERAMLLSSILVTAIFGASNVKYNHSGLKLTVTDLPLAFAGTVPFFMVQYPLAVVAVLAGGIALILAAVAALIYVPGPPVSLELQVLLFSISDHSCRGGCRSGADDCPSRHSGQGPRRQDGPRRRCSDRAGPRRPLR